MRVGSFSLLIPEGVERQSGHVHICHQKQYTLRLGNHDYNRRADATVTVDGKVVGCWRLERGQTITLERPSHDTGRFTFYKKDSAEAAQAGAAGISADAMGLVAVVFRPERTPPPVQKPHFQGMLRTCGMSGFNAAIPQTFSSSSSYGGGAECCVGASGPIEAGMTGLSGVSDQQFHEVASLDYDPSLETTITVRLVGIADDPRELTPATPRANKVPEPV